MVSDMAFTLKDLEVRLFTDGADKTQIREMAKQPGSGASPPTRR